MYDDQEQSPRDEHEEGREWSGHEEREQRFAEILALVQKQLDPADRLRLAAAIEAQEQDADFIAKEEFKAA